MIISKIFEIVFSQECVGGIILILPTILMKIMIA